MATRGFLVAVAIVVAISAPAALAEEIMVGDLPIVVGGCMALITRNGLKGSTSMLTTPSENATVFDYSPGEHNVIKVDERTQLEKCEVPDSVHPTTNGFDKYNLDKEGEHYFICGFKGHCSIGNMKLTVNVMPKKK